MYEAAVCSIGSELAQMFAKSYLTRLPQHGKGDSDIKADPAVVTKSYFMHNRALSALGAAVCGERDSLAALATLAFAMLTWPDGRAVYHVFDMCGVLVDRLANAGLLGDADAAVHIFRACVQSVHVHGADDDLLPRTTLLTAAVYLTLAVGLNTPLICGTFTEVLWPAVDARRRAADGARRDARHAHHVHQDPVHARHGREG